MFILAVPLRMTANAIDCYSIYLSEMTADCKYKDLPLLHTLKLSNVPPYVTGSSLTTFFSNYGPVDKVVFVVNKDEMLEMRINKAITEFSNYQQAFAFKEAYIVFKQATSVIKAMNGRSIDLFQSNGFDSTVKTGVSLWYDSHLSKILNRNKIMQSVHETVVKYNKNQEEKERLEKEKQKPDAEGWITVGNRGRNAGFQQNKNQLDNLRIRMKAKSGELSDFYAHQHTEKKKNELIALRQKYADDKKRILSAKQSRNFQPL